ncbi:MAG TPA: hypothetical protein VKB34_08640 [Povalibacter sp.]|nr:hypothetical protein [Povalibacter sp.]
MSKLPDKIVGLGPAVGVTLCIVGLVGYLLAFVLAVFFSHTSLGTNIKAAFEGNLAANVGIPCSALAAFALVGTLWRAFPPKQSDGQLQLKVFGLDFTGPSGPVTLWVVCFLAFIFAIRLLMKGG